MSANLGHLDQDDPADRSPKMQLARSLIDALCDESITPEQFSQLDSLVCSDREVRRYYVHLVHLHAGLYYFGPGMLEMVDAPLRLGEEAREHSGVLSDSGVLSGGESARWGMNETMVVPAMVSFNAEGGDDNATEDTSEIFAPPVSALAPAPEPAQISPATIIKIGIAAILTLTLGLLAYFVPSMNSPSLEAYKTPPVRPPWYVASVEVTASPVWESGPLLRPDFIAGESMILESGSVQLRLRHNAHLVVEGPADIRFMSDSQLCLNRGKIVATCPGGGLTVQCPNGSIHDLGTEFGVCVDQEKASTEVEVFEGKVAASLSRDPGVSPVNPVVLKVGQAAVLAQEHITSSPQGAVPQRYICNLQSDQVTSLDAVDLLCGGDGTTHRRGIAIDALTGAIGVFPPAAGRAGDWTFHPGQGFPVIDGAFVPDGSKGPMIIDSAGHQFAFPPTVNSSLNQIWTGGPIPWFDDLGISTSFDGIDYSVLGHGIVCTHADNAITLNLDAIRHLYPGRVLNRFECGVGNSYVNGLKGASKMNPVASVYVIVDGMSRYQKVRFTNHNGLSSIDLPITPSDHFLTLAAIDDGKEIDRDWILWTDPKFDLGASN